MHERGRDVDEDGETVEKRHRFQGLFHGILGLENEAADEDKKGAWHDAGEDRWDEPGSDDSNHPEPVDALLALFHQRKPNGRRYYRVCTCQTAQTPLFTFNKAKKPLSPRAQIWVSRAGCE